MSRAKSSTTSHRTRAAPAHAHVGAYDRVAGRGAERLAGLSDGVFAFAMTVMVLEVRIPPTADVRSEATLLAALSGLGPHLLVYLMSFLTLGIFWLAQQSELSQLASADRDVSWVHLAFLAMVAVIPFSTALLAAFITYRTPLLVYWANLVALGVCLHTAWWIAERRGLLKHDMPAGYSRAIMRRGYVAQSLYAVGAALCVFSAYASIVFIIAVQLNFALAVARIFPRRMPA